VRAHDLRGSLYDITELTGNESCDSTTTSITHDVDDDDANTKENIQPTIPIVKTSYAEVMRGKIIENNEKVESEKLRTLSSDVVDYPPKTVQIFDDVQFPPVCQAWKPQKRHRKGRRKD